MTRFHSRIFTLLGFVVLFIVLSSCSNVGYYSQSVGGHTALMLAREPVDKVMATAEEPLKQRLQAAAEIRQFAIDSLYLPDNKSYTSYVELGRDYPVWNVIAASPLSLHAKQWCYPVVGCASYRGYFKKAAAERYAEKLKAEGYDVMVSGATAYSTLGWFADPLLSSMFRRGDASLAELIFHELAHQQLYVKGDSRFNEAFASAVGEQGAMYWLEQTGRQGLLARYQQQLAVYDDFLGLINSTRAQLLTLYEADFSDEKKLEQKEKIFRDMKADYELIKQQRWQGKGWYDRWFSLPLNNARLALVATYRDLVPDFVGLFTRCEKDFQRFYERVEEVSKSEDKALDVAC